MAKQKEEVLAMFIEDIPIEHRQTTQSDSAITFH
jgi:hypothetical protein